ncbi:MULTISPECIES: hypothetical protein [Streptomyces]|uniref:Lipoprotein n=1 Tax=Streptomyces albus (strain ATCC 21838 / DSM 41398 / FERM P-419 / JCM 4703 / NBRC 107858) TaxID=1081613 RepID=A0A0B5F4U4_STRA4|nr:hypothetical protein [Streptomyces sp. SCSIO ZS0520]AJE85347.1 hypothetical protein SLNWT_4971 [Streptomyces albus]AOU79654.1 hypothetical protein SLNHY_4963 [Streptomyces albus]AYN35375.1 hypothetical protein DUI70_4877 [Streptomyces albus]
MNRRSMPAAVLSAAAALLLTACGSGDDSKDDDIAGADKGSGKPASASPTPGEQARRPAVSLPSGAENVFEDRKTGDSAKDAVLADNARYVDAVDDSIFRGAVNGKVLNFYATGSALESSVEYIRGYTEDGDAWQGTTRYFDRRVASLKGASATVTYCADESRSFIRNRKSGKVDRTPTTKDSYVLYNTRLVRNAQGVWQTTKVISERGADTCRP